MRYLTGLLFLVVWTTPASALTIRIEWKGVIDSADFQGDAFFVGVPGEEPLWIGEEIAGFYEYRNDLNFRWANPFDSWTEGFGLPPRRCDLVPPPIPCPLEEGTPLVPGVDYSMEPWLTYNGAVLSLFNSPYFGGVGSFQLQEQSGGLVIGRLTSVSVHPIPEPTSALVFASGAFAISVAVRRLRRVKGS